MSRSSQELVKNKLKNPVYSEILLRIHNRHVTVLQLSQELKKSHPTLIEQMRALEADGFVKRYKGAQKNRQYFGINYDKVVREFFKYLKGIRPKRKIPKEFITNPYVKLYFILMFKKYADKGTYITVEQLFENTRYSLIDSYTIKGKKKHERDFDRFARWLRHYFYADDLYEDVLEDVAERITEMQGNQLVEFEIELDDGTKIKAEGWKKI